MKRLPAWIQGVFYYMEIFKDIPNYEGIYQASNLGRVKSLKNELILKQIPNRRGYLKVNLYKDKKQRTFEVHKLVAMAILGHVPCGYKEVVDHIDNNKLNNNVDNLQLITQRANNSKDRSGNSKYVGVCWHKRDKLFRAAITIKGKVIHLGNFKDELKAAEAYQNALKNL